MSDSQRERRETRDERAHRIASQILLQERMEREQKTARLRAIRLKRQKTAIE